MRTETKYMQKTVVSNGVMMEMLARVVTSKAADNAVLDMETPMTEEEFFDAFDVRIKRHEWQKLQARLAQLEAQVEEKERIAAGAGAVQA